MFKLNIGKNIIKLFALRRKNIRKYLYLIGTLLFIYAYIVGDYGIYQLIIKKSEEKRFKEDIEFLKVEYEELQKEKVLIDKGDLQVTEKIAREKYGMAKPGEKVFHIIIKEKE